MYNTTFVTAFFNINRESWSTFPRNNDVYLNHFSRLCEIKNDIIVYTSEDLKEEVLSRVKHDNVRVICIDWKKAFPGVIEKVTSVQQTQEFRDKIGNALLDNPEYKYPEYVALTTRKSEFVWDAVGKGIVKTPYVGWIDFGYVREKGTLNEKDHYDFKWDDDKIHMFSREDYKNATVEAAILRNRVFFMGGSFIGKKETWKEFNTLWKEEFERLLKEGLVDDDQGYLTACYLKKPDMFSIHKAGWDWFPLFKI